jgi:hypothetical protein
MAIRTTIHGAVRMPGPVEIGQTVNIEIEAVITKVELDRVDVRSFGDEEDSTFMPGEMVARADITNAKRLLEASDARDFYEQEMQLRDEISRLTQLIHDRNTLIAQLKKQNPDGTYVPGLTRTIEILTQQQTTEDTK